MLFAEVVIDALRVKMRLFSCVLVILTVVQTEWHATDSQNIIFNNFEEYYNYEPGSKKVLRLHQGYEV